MRHSQQKTKSFYLNLSSQQRFRSEGRFSWFVLALRRATLRQACELHPAVHGLFHFPGEKRPLMNTAERNRLNAQSSTGPRTEEGKVTSSKNALKTGLTGRTVLLPSDDAAAFEQHVNAYFDEYKPQGLRERELVQSLAETRWRLNRIFALEAALFSQVAADAEEGTPVPGHLENLLKYEKTLKNLHLQEARLHRRFDKDLVELRELQETRAREEMLATNAASPAAALDPKMASNLQMLKDMLEMDGFKLPNVSKSPSNGKHSPKF